MAGQGGWDRAGGTENRPLSHPLCPTRRNNRKAAAVRGSLSCLIYIKTIVYSGIKYQVFIIFDISNLFFILYVNYIFKLLLFCVSHMLVVLQQQFSFPAAASADDDIKYECYNVCCGHPDQYVLHDPYMFENKYSCSENGQGKEDAEYSSDL